MSENVNAPLRRAQQTGLSCSGTNILADLPHDAAVRLKLGTGACIFCGCQEYKGENGSRCSASNHSGGVCNHEYDEHFD